jgi:hypothetical protein
MTESGCVLPKEKAMASDTRGPYLYADAGDGRGFVMVETDDPMIDIVAIQLVKSRKAKCAEVRFDGVLVFEAYALSNLKTLAWRSAIMSAPAFEPMDD